MEPWDLQTMKQVAAHVGRPAHRIIHLCEMKVVCPTVGAVGRGSVRRFCREEIFRVALALELQDAGAEVSLLRQLMGRLDDLMAVSELKAMRARSLGFDILSALSLLGNDQEPVLAWLTAPTRIALVIPKLILSSRRMARHDFHTDTSQLWWRSASLVANLTKVAALL